MLAEVEKVFTDSDNELLQSPPTKEEVREVLSVSNLLAAPGTDGIPSLLYSVCWNVLGEALTEVVQSIHQGSDPTRSMKTSMMVFGTKPKKPNSLKPGDKRRISLLNSDYKVVTGIEARRFSSTATHSLSPIQLVAGSDRRIHHGINLARDAIQAVGRGSEGCGILDLDFLAGFDWLVMEWVYEVLVKKGVWGTVVDRLRRLYADSNSIVVVNNVLGKSIPNKRGSLRQGDIPSMYWFGVGIDPLLHYLDKRLRGIPIISIPVPGPALEHCLTQPTLTQRYKVQAYADDVKPAITSMREFIMVDEACTMLERAAGVKLHRDPITQKVKFLPLGRWRGTLKQEDLPHQCQYILISDHLDFVGVELRATFIQTRKVNGDKLVEIVNKTVGPWKGGRFMPLTMRPHSVNTFALSRVWFKCPSINLRVSDCTAINSQVKGWLYQDLLQKPSELVLHRSCEEGGLGLFHVSIRALALRARSFMETAANPSFRHSLLHEILYLYHVKEDRSIPNPGYLPYYDEDFFAMLRHYKNTVNISVITTRTWYKILLDDRFLMAAATENSPPTLLPVRAELLSPETNWPRSWARMRTRGISSHMASFLFKLMHLLLPVQSRVFRLGADRDNAAGCCLLCQEPDEDLHHAFFSCPTSRSAGLATLGWVHHLIPTMTHDMALRLEMLEEVDINSELAAISILATGLKYIWETRIKKKRVLTHEVRAEMEALVSLLRRSRFKEAGERVNDALLTDMLIL